MADKAVPKPLKEGIVPRRPPVTPSQPDKKTGIVPGKAPPPPPPQKE